MCRTNPISRRRKRLTEEFVRNEANLAAGGTRLWIEDCGLEDAGRGGCRRVSAQNEPNLARPEGKCAEQTQLAGRGKWS
jgi:hypothetical protein